MFTFTEEAKQAAKEARREKRETGLATYKQDWKDDVLWQQLAKKANIRLPQSHIPPSGIKLTRLAKQLGLAEDWVEGFFGVGSGNATRAINKENENRPVGDKYSHRCYVGMLLEVWNEQNSQLSLQK